MECRESGAVPVDVALRWSKTGSVQKKYPAIVRLWENAWVEFAPFLQFDAEMRRIVCTTNAIES
ncbi:transposase [Streptomyces sp. SCSIO 30461]